MLIESVLTPTFPLESTINLSTISSFTETGLEDAVVPMPIRPESSTSLNVETPLVVFTLPFNCASDTSRMTEFDEFFTSPTNVALKLPPMVTALSKCAAPVNVEMP